MFVRIHTLQITRGNHDTHGTYVGQLSGGQYHGHGEFTFTAGGRYVGQWKTGHHHGHGVYHYPNGDRYVGEWKGGQRHGSGTHFYHNENSFVGQFEAGRMSGRGLYTVANGYSYTGQWKAGICVKSEVPAARPLVDEQLGPALQSLTNAGKWVIGWIRQPEGDILLTHSAPALQQAAAAEVVEVVSTTVQQRITGLAEISAGGRELIGAAAAADGELAFLVRCPLNRQSDIRHDYVSRLFTRFPCVDTLNAGGRVVAYPCVPADSQTAGAAQHLLIWDRTERAEHTIERLTAAQITAQLNHVADPWELAGCAGDAAGYVCVLRRPLADARRQGPTAPQKYANELLHGTAPGAAAARAIEALCATQPQAGHPPLRALASALGQHAAAPWEAYRGLAAAIGTPPGGLDGQALRACLQQLMFQDMQANRLSAVCAAMMQERLDKRDNAPALRPLIEGMLRACQIDTPNAIAAPLAAAIAARSVEATTFLTSLGLREPGARGQAESTGLPALVAAADGDLEGLRQWERLGPRARNTLLWVAQRAAQQSQAAGPDLELRLGALLGITPQQVAELRRFVQRADVWVNFPGNADNMLLTSTTYQPQSAKRNDLERNRFAGHYHDGPLPREELPKYGWLNTHKVRLGLSGFGNSALVLRPHVQLRANWVLRDDWTTNVSAGTSVCMDHILLRLSDSVLSGLWAAHRGERMDRLQNIRDTNHDFVPVPHRAGGSRRWFTAYGG